MRVNTKILKFEEGGGKEIIEESVRTIKNGGIIIYPTETSYGIGADATNIDAVKRIREIKGRSYNKPIIIIVDSIKTMKKYGVVTKKAEKLAKRFMPGPLTIVIKKKKIIPNVVSQRGIAFRVSSHPIAFSLTKEFRGAITSTSANISGKGDVYDSKKLIQLFREKVDLIIDCGKIPRVKPSTIIDMTSKPRIIREGPIPKKLILEELKKNNR